MRLYVLASAKHEHLTGVRVLAGVIVVLGSVTTSTPAQAFPILLGSRHCVCTLVPITQAPEPDPDPSWTLEQIAEAQRLDDLHEPAPGTTGAFTHVITCFDDPQPPLGEKPRIPPGTGGAGGSGGGGGTIPEPGLLGLIVVGVGVWVRQRRVR